MAGSGESIPANTRSKTGQCASHRSLGARSSGKTTAPTDCRTRHSVLACARSSSAPEEAATMSEIRIDSDPHASESLKQIVVDHLDAYNIGVTGMAEYSPINLFLRDQGDEVLGGLL